MHEIEHVIHFERGVLYTIRELIINPGKNIRVYLTDNRSRLVKPIIFVIIASLVYSVLIHFFHIEDQYVTFKGGELSTPVKIFAWIQGHYGYSNIIMGFFIAFWLKLFYRRYEFNFFELLIVLCFVMGIAMLIYSLFALLEGLTKIKLMVIGGMAGISYCTWAIGDFFGKDKISNYIKAMFSYVLGMITFAFGAVFLGVVIDIILKH